MTKKVSMSLLYKPHCRICALELQNSISAMGGVKNVTVNYDESNVLLYVDANDVDIVSVKNSIESLSRSVVHPNLNQEPSLIGRNLFTLISGVLLGIGIIFAFFTLDSSILDMGLWNIRASTLYFFAATALTSIYVIRGGIKAIKEKRLGIDVLMTLAIGGAIAIGEFFEAASLAFLYSVAELLETYATNRSRNSLRELMELAPNLATVRRGDREHKVPVDEVKIDEIVLVRPGEKIPMDGLILKGSSSVNQAPITGESVPIGKVAGEQVFAGSLNIEGFLIIKVTKLAQDSTLAKIIYLVEEAQSEKAPTEQFVEQFGRYYTPAVVILAALVAVVPPLIFSEPFIPWFLRAITLLVISCPCALLISTPVAVVSGITAAARNGVLIKGGMFLEAMGQINAIAMDKTGTLTTGQLEVTDIVPTGDMNEATLLQIAASLESKSLHPIAQAIARANDGQSLLLPVENFRSITAQGVEGTINGQSFVVGKPILFSKFDLEEFFRFQEQGKTVVAVGTKDQVMGIIAVADQIRNDAPATIRALKKRGLEVIMLTGDNEATAKSVASALDITDYHADILPEEKLNEIEKLKKKYGAVAMVGDGVNDAPALAAATVGIAMGAIGTDTALETADIALMSDRIVQLPYLVTLSRKSRNVIKQNIGFSILTKFSLALGIIPGYVTLVMAVLIGDLGATLAVTGNAMRLAKSHNGKPKLGV